MKTIITLIATLLIATSNDAQVKLTFKDGNTVNGLRDGYLNPDRVSQLQLSHQHINIDTFDLSVFKNLEKLTLSYDSLSALPKGLEKLNKLAVLDLSANNFKVLPEELTIIPNLEELYLNNERFLDIDQAFKVINQMSHLKRLHLDSITGLNFPKHLRVNDRIEYISMRYDGLTSIPVGLKKFTHLKTLDLEGNAIKKVNRNFLKNKEIESLTLSLAPQFDFKRSFAVLAKERRLNSLTIVNSTFEQDKSDFSVLENITSLSLHNDHLKVFPSSILKMGNLKYLDLSGNDFKTLPSTFLSLSKLQILDLSDDNFLNFDQTADVIRYLPSLQLVHVHDYDFTFNPQSYLALKQNGNTIEMFPGTIKNKNVHIFKTLKPASPLMNVPFNNFNAEGFGIRLGF